MEKKEENPHIITITDRKECCLTGVNKVISATPVCVSVQTRQGMLTINGSGLKLTSFSEKSETLSIVGEIVALKYGTKTSALKKIFG